MYTPSKVSNSFVLEESEKAIYFTVDQYQVLLFSDGKDAEHIYKVNFILLRIFGHHLNPLFQIWILLCNERDRKR